MKARDVTFVAVGAALGAFATMAWDLVSTLQEDRAARIERLEDVLIREDCD